MRRERHRGRRLRGHPARAQLLGEHGFTVLAVGADDALSADASAALVAQARALG